jgi:hypothetical protein
VRLLFAMAMVLVQLQVQVQVQLQVQLQVLVRARLGVATRARSWGWGQALLHCLRLPGLGELWPAACAPGAALVVAPVQALVFGGARAAD